MRFSGIETIWHYGDVRFIEKKRNYYDRMVEGGKFEMS